MAGDILTWQAAAPGACAAANADERKGGNAAAAPGNAEKQPDPRRLELEALYLIRRPEMIRFLVSFGMNAVEAEDITQEAFLRGFDQCRKNKSIDNFFYWLLACARNLALKRIRHEKYELPPPAGRWKQYQNGVPRINSTPETELLQQEEYRLLAEALSSLSPIEQQCIVLRFQDAPFREIATTLAISMRSAVYHTGTGIRKLRRKLEASIR